MGTDAGSSHGHLLPAGVVCLALLFALLLLTRTVVIVKQAEHGHRGAAGSLPAHPQPRPEHPRARDRPHPRARRHARAGGVVPAAAGDHRGQPRRVDRHRHLLPGHRSEGRDLRDQQLHHRHRAAHRHDAAQRDRLDGPGGGPDLARPDQRPAARRARRGDRQVGHPRQPCRAEGDRPAEVGAGVDGEAAQGRARAPRGDPHCGGRQAVGDPQRRGRRSRRPS